MRARGSPWAAEQNFSRSARKALPDGPFSTCRSPDTAGVRSRLRGLPGGGDRTRRSSRWTVPRKAEPVDTDQPRIPPRQAPFPDDVQETLGSTLSTPGGAPLNIFATLAHHPRLLKRFNVLGGLFLSRGLLPPRDREIVILRVGWN